MPVALRTLYMVSETISANSLQSGLGQGSAYVYLVFVPVMLMAERASSWIHGSVSSLRPYSLHDLGFCAALAQVPKV